MRVDLRVKHDVETRRHAAELFDSGAGCLGRLTRLSVPRGTVRQWQRVYRAFRSEVLLNPSPIPLTPFTPRSGGLRLWANWPLRFLSN